MLLFLWPIGLLRAITVPSAGPEGLWSRPLAVISPITVPLLLLVSLKGNYFSASSLMINVVYIEYETKLEISTVEIPIWAIILAIGAIFSIVVFFTTENQEPPRYYMVCAKNRM